MSGSKTYEELDKKIKEILGDDIDTLTLSDEALQKLVGLGFPAEDLETFKLIRDIRKQSKLRKMLVVPDLPKDHTLTLPEFQKFESEGSKVELKLPGDASTIQTNAIKYESIEAADWLKVVINCNILHAHTFKKLGEPDDIIFNPIFLPPNKSLYNTRNFTVSQESLSYHAESQRSEYYNYKSVMTDIGGSILFQTPWVSGSAEYSHQTKLRSVEKGTKVTSICKIEFPIGVITLPRPSEINSNSIKLNDEFSKYVDDLLSTPQITKQKFSEELCKEYGDVVPRNTTIGIACYTTETSETKKTQSLSEVSDSFKSSVSAAYDNLGRTLSMNQKKSSTSDSGNTDVSSSYQFIAIAGSLPDPRNPISIANDRLEPGSWRAINLGSEFIPVIKYLSRDIQSALNNLPGKWPRPIDPIFDYITKSLQYYIVYQKEKDYGLMPILELPNYTATMPFFLILKRIIKMIPYTIRVKEKITNDEIVVTFKFEGDDFLAMNSKGILDRNSQIPTDFVLKKCTDEPDGLVFIKLRQSNSEAPQYLKKGSGSGSDYLKTLCSFELSGDPQPFILMKTENF